MRNLGVGPTLRVVVSTNATSRPSQDKQNRTAEPLTCVRFQNLLAFLQQTLFARAVSRAKAKLIFAFCVATLTASAQRFSNSLHFPQKVPLPTFESCGDAEASAKQFSKAIPNRVYVLELLPSNQQSLFVPFLSDAGGFLWQALRYSYRSQAPPPRAILYFVNGRYAFRCRDNHEHFTESSGPDGNPLRLGIAPSKDEIWHFSITEEGMAHVFIVTDQPLDEVDGGELMAQLREKLGMKVGFVYVRNDPWFFASSGDAAPYIFAADRFKPMSEEEYLNGKTLVCRSDIGCKVSLNKHIKG